MILKIQFSAKKTQKNMLHRNTYPVEEFMSFKEELVFTGVNHPSYLFANMLKTIHFFFIDVVYSNNFSILTLIRGSK